MAERSHSRPVKTIWGFRPTDLLGIALMIVPFYITFKEFTYVKGLFLWVTTTAKTSIKPGMVSSLCAVAFYVALMLRCQLFKGETMTEGIVSAIRFILNCWVIASLMTMIVPTETVRGLSLSVFLKNNQSTFLLIGIVLSWLGMRTISGYCWILFIIAAWNNLQILDEAMGMWGAIYIITFSLSLLLQITNYVALTDLLQDFKGGISKYAPTVRENIRFATDDAQIRAKKVANHVASMVSEPGNIRPRFHVTKDGTIPISDAPEQNSSQSMPKGDASVLLKALDVNGDGIIDEKDIEILRAKNK